MLECWGGDWAWRECEGDTTLDRRWGSVALQAVARHSVRFTWRADDRDISQHSAYHKSKLHSGQSANNINKGSVDKHNSTVTEVGKYIPKKFSGVEPLLPARPAVIDIVSNNPPELPAGMAPYASGEASKLPYSNSK